MGAGGRNKFYEKDQYEFDNEPIPDKPRVSHTYYYENQLKTQNGLENLGVRVDINED